MNLESIRKLIEILDARTENKTYFIPEAWNCTSYEDFEKTNTRASELAVNPYKFYSYSLNFLLKNKSDEHKKSKVITDRVIYSMLPRMFTAWNHYDKDTIIGGSFLKATTLIPYLKRLGIDTVYLLPVFKNSKLYKKGNVGSPYSIKDIYKLEKELHDDLLGEYSDELINLQFKAFVEACHLWDIKVMVDFVFRTVARDNDLIVKHPEWFYWIDLKHKDNFSVFPVKDEKPLTSMSDEALKSLYNSKGLEAYLGMFKNSPNIIDNEKWNSLKEQLENADDHMLSVIETNFGVTTVPGFSDVLNDIQPPWSDVTFLKFYFDLHEEAKAYISENQVPYILQDGIKLNLYRGKEKNMELWDYIENVIPYYQNEFGIDGARIDMGHALPPELNKAIVSKAFSINENFILWSEEFNPKNASDARNAGFNFISGALRWDYKKLEKSSFNKTVMGSLKKSVLPLTGALETPDTPRIALTHHEKIKLAQLHLLNSFIPNAVSFINNGQELAEIQPMNLGLDNTEEGRWVLRTDDPMYGKLAFFDNYVLHWTSNNRKWMELLLTDINHIRNCFRGLVGRLEYYNEGFIDCEDKKLTVLFYSNKQDNALLIANRDFKKEKVIAAREMISKDYMGIYNKIMVVFSQTSLSQGMYDLDEKISLLPGEVLVGRFIK